MFYPFRFFFPTSFKWTSKYLLRIGGKIVCMVIYTSNIPFHCMIQSTDRDVKLVDITSAVLERLSASCVDCGIDSDIIDRQSFSCYPESPTYVTYRARLEGTSESDSGSLISLIEEWVSGGASIIVTGVLMTVDSECSVAISSLSEGECSPTQPPTTVSPTDTKPPITDNTTASEGPSSSTDQTSTDNTAAIIGGVVAIVLIIAITVIIVIVVLVMKNRRGDLFLKNAEK